MIYTFSELIFIYLLLQMPSRSPKGEAPARVARRKARPRATSDAFRPILPLAEARAGSKQLKIGRPGTGRLEIGRLWKGLVRVCPVRTPRTRAGKVLELEFGL